MADTLTMYEETSFWAREHGAYAPSEALAGPIDVDVAVVGGTAKDAGLIHALKKRLGVDLFVPEGPEFAGAIGAALP